MTKLEKWEFPGPNWHPGETIKGNKIINSGMYREIDILERITTNDVSNFGKTNLEEQGKVSFEIGDNYLRITYKDGKMITFKREGDSTSVFLKEMDRALIIKDLYLANTFIEEKKSEGVKYMGICDKVINFMKLNGDLYKPK
jgi:ketosteroid isomerase-like protein